MRSHAALALSILLTFATGAQDGPSFEDRLVQGMQSIHPAWMREALAYLASDELEGRLAGFPGNDRATEFIAARYREAGLTPVGDPGVDGKATYYQHFQTPHGTRTRNTVGVLEGTDPELKKEFLVIGAHHDHVGRLGQRGPGKIGGPVDGDEIWNGADDNGSGTTTVLSIARAFSVSGLRLRRSVLFLTFSAEEWGLLGSKHYVEHPIFPLDTIAAMLNLDMVGRGSLDRPTSIGGMATAKGDIFREAVTRAAKAADIRVALEDSYGLGSDMASFGARRVPVLSFTENGPCPDYHRVTDHADKIEYEYMARIGRMVFLTIVELGNRHGRPEWNPDFPIPPEGGRGGGPRLGITTEEPSDAELAALKLGGGEGAVRVTGVIPGSVAEACGLREGDLLLGFGGSRLPRENTLGELRKRISEVQPGIPVLIEFARDGERRQVEATWPP